MLKTVVCLSVLLCNIWVAHAASKLETYNVDRSSVTVSGLSSGGAMAMQLHFAFSKDIHGAGIVAGLPYACAKGGLVNANLCMYSPGTVNVANLITEINNQAYAGKIDLTENVSGDKVFIFHGTKDTTVNPAAAGKTKEIYERFGAVIETELTLGAVHGYPTDFYGAACGSSSAMTQYINNCQYHGAYHVLNYIHNNTLTPPTGSTPIAGELKEFDQGEFGGNAATSMDSTGFVYIPSGCKDRTQKCKFHISLHGCSQSKATIQNIYATKTGYLEVAELNNIIVIFPQATANIMAGNPNACWDWWGYLNANFINKDGAQMKAIHRMLVRVAQCDGASSCYEDNVTTTTTITPAPTGPTTVGPTTTVDPTNPCRDNEVSFHPFPGMCQFYTMCACGAQVLLQCAPGLYFDPSINNCNFIQLVPCENGTA